MKANGHLMNGLSNHLLLTLPHYTYSMHFSKNHFSPLTYMVTMTLILYDSSPWATVDWTMSEKKQSGKWSPQCNLDLGMRFQISQVSFNTEERIFENYERYVLGCTHCHTATPHLTTHLFGDHLGIPLSRSVWVSGIHFLNLSSSPSWLVFTTWSVCNQARLRILFTCVVSHDICWKTHTLWGHNTPQDIHL